VPGIVDFNEATDIEDSFTATQEIIGGYGMFDMPIVRDMLKLNAGARYEYSLIRLDTGIKTQANSGFCPNGEDQCITHFNKKNTDVFPGINLVYSPRTDMNLRLSYSQSVARPEFRELAPATFPKIAGERERRGNPDLVQSDITSYDIRWEWFFSPLELVSAGFFYKDLSGPIEQVTVIIGTDPVDTWVNGGDATLYGIEVEGRKDFAFVNERLRPLSLMVNGSWADSSVDIPAQQFFGLTTLQSSSSRRWSASRRSSSTPRSSGARPTSSRRRMLYFTAAQSIASAGFNGLDDIEFQRRDQLDAVFLMPLKQYFGYPLTLRLSAENILNSPYVYTQGPIVQEKYTTGVKFTIGLTLTQ
jgi:outer membrane receptor protein involved in Fe transport